MRPRFTLGTADISAETLWYCYNEFAPPLSFRHALASSLPSALTVVDLQGEMGPTAVAGVESTTDIVEGCVSVTPGAADREASSLFVRVVSDLALVDPT